MTLASGLHFHISPFFLLIWSTSGFIPVEKIEQRQRILSCQKIFPHAKSLIGNAD
jgi:hypothetical protein